MLTVSQRVANYYAQRYAHVPGGMPLYVGGTKLSGRQRRRIKHKRGHAIRMAVRGRVRRAAIGG